MRKDQGYKCRLTKDCDVNKNYRNRCQYCRLKKCIAAGMSRDGEYPTQSDNPRHSDQFSQTVKIDKTTRTRTFMKNRPDQSN